MKLNPRNILAFAAALITSLAFAHAQSTTLAVSLTYSASGTVELYRTTVTGATCPAIASGSYDEITDAATQTGPYIDTTVVAGDSYCWYATQTLAGYSGPSGPSNIYGPLTVDLSPANEPVPTGLTGTVVQLTGTTAVKVRPPAPTFGAVPQK